MASLDGLLPPIGLEIPMFCYGVNVPLQVDGLGLVSLDFKGGIKVQVVKNISSGLGGVQLEVIGFEVNADSPVLGTVTMSQADLDTAQQSKLEALSDRPPVFRSTFCFDYTLTIEKPPGGGTPMTLASAKTATLINNNLTVFPPQGAVYQLQQPVDLAPVGQSSPVVATLQQFPVTISHNA